MRYAWGECAQMFIYRKCVPCLYGCQSFHCDFSRCDTFINWKLWWAFWSNHHHRHHQNAKITTSSPLPPPIFKTVDSLYRFVSLFKYSSVNLFQTFKTFKIICDNILVSLNFSSFSSAFLKWNGMIHWLKFNVSFSLGCNSNKSQRLCTWHSAFHCICVN